MKVYTIPIFPFLSVPFLFSFLPYSPSFVLFLSLLRHSMDPTGDIRTGEVKKNIVVPGYSQKTKKAKNSEGRILRSQDICKQQKTAKKTKNSEGRISWSQDIPNGLKNWDT